jgi:hypothetical protein
MKWVARIWGYTLTLLLATIGLSIGFIEIFQLYNDVGSLPLVYLAVTLSVILLFPLSAWVLFPRSGIAVSTGPRETLGTRYWSLVGLALLVLIPVDMFMTVFATRTVGVTAEANPIMRWALQQGLLHVAVVNIAATLVLAGFFVGLEKVYQRAEPPVKEWVRIALYGWLLVLILAAGAVAAQNLHVALYQEGLF